MSAHHEELNHIEKLIEIGIALSAERDNSRLLEMILLGAKELTHADGGTLYSVTENKAVKMEIMRTDSLNFAMGGTTGKDIPFAPIPLYEDGQPNENNVVTSAVINNRTVNIADAYSTGEYDFSGTREFDRKTGYRSTSFLTVPMKNHEGDIIGVLQLLNAQDPASAAVIPFSAEAQRLTEALASQAAIALTNKRLIDDLKSLFESMIQLIADAIDEKSPYTGGHCRRVPVLTMLLADAANRSQEGALRDFSMSADQRYELEIAAWLHDCGKITTPEYVVDKSTKLETIYDRIHLVDCRYEVLQRDAEIALLQRQVHALEQGLPFDSEKERQLLQSTRRQLEAERHFLHDCNKGSEFMSESDRARVEALAQRSYVDHAGKVMHLLSQEEIDNLNIVKGTLTDDERAVINNHIVATIKMLESLPFPKHLKNVPEFAGGHHERVDGLGYPRGLRGEQMSVQARVMAIADIFEALTAKDRPYKQGKKLSETLRILSFMKDDGHIDPDLFEIFVKEKVYRTYAELYMDPDQIDEIDEQSLLGHQPAAETS